MLTSTSRQDHAFFLHFQALDLTIQFPHQIPNGQGKNEFPIEGAKDFFAVIRQDKEFFSIGEKFEGWGGLLTRAGVIPKVMQTQADSVEAKPVIGKVFYHFELDQIRK